jgi:hypothetical protein
MASPPLLSLLDSSPKKAIAGELSFQAAMDEARISFEERRHRRWPR